MATVFENRPAGVDEALVVADPLVWDVVTGTPRYDRDPAITFQDVVASIRFDNAGGTAVQSLDQVFTATSTRYTTRVWRTNAVTAGTFVTLSRWRNGGATTTVEVRRLTAANALVFRLDGVTVATSNTLSTSTSFRYEVDLAGTTANFRVYADASSTIPTQTFGPFTYSGATFDRIVDGVGNAAGATTAWLQYAVDGDTSNPSISRWVFPAPTNFRLESKSGTTAVLAWDDVAGTGETYEIEQDGVVVATGVTGTSRSITSLSPGTTYLFRLAAVTT